jgi:hypothetical protein
MKQEDQNLKLLLIFVKGADEFIFRVDFQQSSPKGLRNAELSHPIARLNVNDVFIFPNI